MTSETSKSPSEQIMDNIDFRVRSLQAMLTNGAMTEHGMLPLERRSLLIRRRRQVLLEGIETARPADEIDSEENSDTEAYDAQSSHSTAPSMSSAGTERRQNEQGF